MPGTTGGKTILDKIEGRKYSATSVRDAIKGGGKRARRTSSQYRSALPEDDFSGASTPPSGQRLLAASALSMEYTPVKYEKQFTPSASEAFFESATSTEPRKYSGTVPLHITDQGKTIKLESQPLRLLSSRETFQKNSHSCDVNLGFKKRTNRCVYYYLISKVCILVDKVEVDPSTLTYIDNKTKANKKVANDTASSTNSTSKISGDRRLAAKELAWQVVGSCGAEHNRKLADSREFRQQIDFHGYPFTIEVRSA